MLIYILLFIDIVAILLVTYFLIKIGLRTLSANIKGFIGELIVRILIGSTDIQNSYFVLNNIKIPTEDGSAQIDHIIICCSGVYVIETKNYKGLIYANEYDYEWIQNIYGKRYYFYSPYLQNEKHCYILSDILGTEENIYNVIVFVKNNVDKRYCSHIYYLEQLRHIKHYTENILSQEQCTDYYKRILQYKLK